MSLAREDHSKERSLLFLDGLRGLAAFYVMVGHARWVLWEGYTKGFIQHPETYNALNKALVYMFSFFRYGHEAVLFFFVLSGFVIHLRYSFALKHSGRSAQFGWISFVMRRVRRLYPPLLLAMAVTFAADLAGPKIAWKIVSESAVYLNTDSIIHPSHSVSTLVGNLLFLMNSFVPVWGSNGVLWSLKFEWWFYMLYPLFWMLSKRSMILSGFAIFGLYFTALQIDQGTGVIKFFADIFSLMSVWWIGVILADVYSGRISIRFKYLSIFAGVLPVLLMSGVHWWKSMGWGLFFAGIISFCFYLHECNIRLKFLEAFRGLGDMSYTLYVTHFPILFLLSRILISKKPDAPHLPNHFTWCFLGIVLCLCTAYLCHFFVERPFTSRTRQTV